MQRTRMFSGWPALPTSQIASALLVLLVAAGPVGSEVTRDVARRYGVDILVLKGGVELRGLIVSRSAERTKLAVQRDWLRQAEPEYFRENLELERVERARALDTLRMRIAVWLESRDLVPGVRQFLEMEAERLEGAAKEEEPAQFMVVDVPVDHLRRIYPARREARVLAASAFEQQLPKVEETIWPRLRELLQEVEVGDRNESPDLSDRLPSLGTESEASWRVRQALVEYSFGRRLDFQRFGNVVFEAGTEAPRPDLATLIESVTQEQLAGVLGETRETWRDEVLNSAERRRLRAVRVTSIETGVKRGAPRVASEFLVRSRDGSWCTAWSAEVDPRQANIDPVDRIRIQNDPQIQELGKLAESIGLGTAMNQAQDFGAATLVAQRALDGLWWEFVMRYTERLDGPAVPDSPCVVPMKAP